MQKTRQMIVVFVVQMDKQTPISSCIVKWGDFWYLFQHRLSLGIMGGFVLKNPNKGFGCVT